MRQGHGAYYQRWYIFVKFYLEHDEVYEPGHQLVTIHASIQAVVENERVVAGYNLYLAFQGWFATGCGGSYGSVRTAKRRSYEQE